MMRSPFSTIRPSQSPLQYRSHRLRRLTLILLASFGPGTFTCFLPALESLNQAPAAQSEAQHKISINSDLVVLPVTVKEKNGNLVADLELSDFRVFDDELEQTPFGASLRRMKVGIFLLTLLKRLLKDVHYVCTPLWRPWRDF